MRSPSVIMCSLHMKRSCCIFPSLTIFMGINSIFWHSKAQRWNPGKRVKHGWSLTFFNQEVHFWRLENQITDPVCTVEVLSWIWAALVHFIHGLFFYFYFFSVNTNYMIHTVKLTSDIRLWGESASLTPFWFKGQFLVCWELSLGTSSGVHLTLGFFSPCSFCVV